ncbi:MAG: hypothetical protein V2I67_01375 [Thermoanaerobaculales bacterium]|nr:hypothetical protein [Thermoanaerobaculales bacterium]
MDTTPEARVFQLVLTDELRRPVMLTPDEVVGGWRELFPNLASCLPTPYPIFGRDEEKIVTHGYPVLRSDGISQLQRSLDNLVNAEVDYRLVAAFDPGADKRAVMAERDRFHRSLLRILENVFMNDYGRGMTEIFLLLLSSEVSRSASRVPRLVRKARRNDDDGVSHRQAVAGVLGGLIQRAAHGASDRLRKLAQVRLAPKISPLLGMISDPLLLTEDRLSTKMPSLASYLQSRFNTDLETLDLALDHGIKKLSQLMGRRSAVGELLAAAAGLNIDLTRSWTLLEPRLLNALARADLLDTIGISKTQAASFEKLGLSFKRFELLSALRRRIVMMAEHDDQLVLLEPSVRGAIAPTTRPFDFTSPGVVDTSVRRFGLVYDLTNFTATLEEVRKEGHRSEEKALQFMYVFQNRLEEIRRDHRLIFEKFLGDGGFYSSRRALRMLAAACEIQQAYDQLRRSGFPFDQGIRIALNHGHYRLLPMLDSDREIRRFEFFGHGIVELSRLTTGKSAREVAEIAEFLIHSGYEADRVDAFLAPLAEARGATKPRGDRLYTAEIDSRGELVNEGIVLTLDFVKLLEDELDLPFFTEVTEHGARWLLFPLNPDRPGPFQVGLRFLGVARLKGLAPVELVEAAVWNEIPAEAQATTEGSSLVALLRRLGQHPDGFVEAEDGREEPIDEDLVVLTYLETDGSQRWVFGRHRPSDDVLLQAVRMPMQIPAMTDEEPLETWLFRNRFELERLYRGVYRTDGGATIHVGPLRQRKGYVACFLAAPHRAP